MTDRLRRRAGIASAAVLAVLGGWHVYWAGGGHVGLGAVVPVREGRELFRPRPVGTLAVALLLFGAARTVLGCVGAWAVPPPFVRCSRRMTWLLAVTFALRAIGDFRYAGFFKRVRGTRFARWDSALYSPLCALLALGCAAAASVGVPRAGRRRR